MNEETNGTKNLLKLVILNISILTLISLIIWTFISYSQGESLNFVNIVLIILVAPFVYSLSKDVSSIYKNFK
jgi:ABC-type phosphate transport system permease subunit